jgi:outer membrane protein assembly factor BamB
VALKTKLPFTAGPAVGYGLVVAGTGKGELLAYDAPVASLRWKVQLGAAVHAVPVLTADRVVVLTSDGVVHMLDQCYRGAALDL